MQPQPATAALVVGAGGGEPSRAGSHEVSASGLSPRVSVVIEDSDLPPPGPSGCGRRSSGGGGGGGGEADTFPVVVFNLAKVILGAGMMAMPKAMYLLGLVPGTLLMATIGLLTQFTLASGLIANSDATGSKSYGTLVRRALGRRAEGVLQVAVFVTCVAMQVVFLVVLGDILIGDPPEHHGLIRELTGLSSGLAASRAFVLGALSLGALLPLGSMRSMDRLAVVNIIGVGSNGVLAALMLALAAASWRQGVLQPLPLWPQWEALVSSKGGPLGAALCLASTVPIILNCFACHQSLFPLLPSLRPYTTARAQAMTATALGVAGVLYYVIALCSSAVFGSSLHDDILADISAARMAPLLGGAAAAHAAALTVRVGYLLSLTGSFVLLNFPARHVLADVILGGHDSLQRRWLPVTAGLTLAVYSTAVFLPTIWDALSLVGATATTMQAWIIPALIVMWAAAPAAAKRGGGGGGSGGARGGARRGKAPGGGEGESGGGASLVAALLDSAASAGSGDLALLSEADGSGTHAAAAAGAPLWRRALHVFLAAIIFTVGWALFIDAILDTFVF